jgi:hypothetical protein
LQKIRRRRAALTERLRPASNLAALEESCVPSYCHPNLLAASVAWWRLVKAAALVRRYASGGPLLDFGAASGEAGHLLTDFAPYHFVEADEALARALVEWNPAAVRERLDALPAQRFACVLALDSLEHNENLPEIVARLAGSLAPGGVLIVSGPTETPLYRLGRRVAGFSGHYHKHTVFDVERATGAAFERIAVASVPPLAALFRVSVWKARPR